MAINESGRKRYAGEIDKFDPSDGPAAVDDLLDSLALDGDCRIRNVLARLDIEHTGRPNDLHAALTGCNAAEHGKKNESSNDTAVSERFQATHH